MSEENDNEEKKSVENEDEYIIVYQLLDLINRNQATLSIFVKNY